MADSGYQLSAIRYLVSTAMTVGILTILLSIPGSNSLKDKRQVVKSMLDSVRNRFNISAAEIDHLDSHRSAGLAFACVSNDKGVANGLLDKILNYVESNPLCEVTEVEIEFL